MRILLPVIAPFLAALTALLMFVYWYTALAYLVGFGIFLVLAVRFHDKHNRGYQYDDHKPTELQEEAIRRYIKEVRKQDVED